MEFLPSLWLPILVSAVVLFLMSFVFWTMLPHHGQDYRKLPNEDGFLGSIREGKIPSGRYMFPFVGDHKNAQKEEIKAKCEQGPMGTITIFGKVNMGRNLGLTFLFFLVTSAIIAYVLWTVFAGSSPDFARVFRVAGTVSVLAYCVAGIPNDIWFRRPFVTNFIDGIAYAMVSGLLFAALWPKA